MKNRVVKKLEKRLLIDKVCDLQMQIDEYERFLGDLLILLIKKEPQCVIKHEICEKGELVWEKVRELVDENKELVRKLQEKE